MQRYRILSCLLDYPEQDLRDALPEIDETLAQWPEMRSTLLPLTHFLASGSLIDIQENYVATFDRNPRHSLHLFEHIHGESRDRGQAMVDLLEEYLRHGFEPSAKELPDYVPLFLEFLGLLPTEQASPLLGDAIHVLAVIGRRLAESQSPYACIFQVLRAMTDVQPREQVEPPVRDMDEAMEVFGVGPDGVEPLLNKAPIHEQAVKFYPRGTVA